MTEGCENSCHLNKSESFLLSKFQNALKLFANKPNEEVKEAFRLTKDLLIQKKFNEWIMPNIIHMLIGMRL